MYAGQPIKSSSEHDIEEENSAPADLDPLERARGRRHPSEANAGGRIADDTEALDTEHLSERSAACTRSGLRVQADVRGRDGESPSGKPRKKDQTPRQAPDPDCPAEPPSLSSCA